MPQLVGKPVGPIGYGMMGLTWRAEPASDEQAFAALNAAVSNGATFWNGAEFYGHGDANSLALLERYFAKYPENADKVTLSIKGAGKKPFAMDWDSSAANVRRSVEDSVAQLKGRKRIDIFEVARHDGIVSWEETLGELEKCVEEGLIGGVALSEVRAETIHKAVKITKIRAVEVELSLMATDVLTNGVAEACAQYDIPLVAYSPLGKGFLSGKLKTRENLDLIQQRMPRYSEENFPINLQLVAQVEQLAKKKGCTTAQLSLNWVRELGNRPGMPTIIVLPGGTTAERVTENSKIVEIIPEGMAEIDATLAKFEVAGERFPPGFNMEN